jgi:predicted transcriptional regulator
MKQLTKAEEQIMKVLWKLDGGLLMEIVENMPNPQPHKNTVATVLRTMMEKGFVKTEDVGRFFKYKPAITKEQYSKSTLLNIAKGYFEGSFANVVSFLIDENKISVKELELLLQQTKKTIK